MSALSPALDAALASRAAIFGVIALKIEVPSATIRLLDGSAAVYIGGELYTGRDDTFGVFTAMEAISDGVDNEAPTLQFVMLPPSNTAMATLASAMAQGSAVTVMLGAVEPSTGQIIGDADVIFAGEIDQTTNKIGRQTKALQISCTSVFDRFLLGDEGARLHNAFHQSIWPDEKGLEFISAIAVRNPWGSDAPRTTLTPNTTSY